MNDLHFFFEIKLIVDLGKGSLTSSTFELKQGILYLSEDCQPKSDKFSSFKASILLFIIGNFYILIFVYFSQDFALFLLIFINY